VGTAFLGIQVFAAAKLNMDLEEPKHRVWKMNEDDFPDIRSFACWL